MKCKILLLISIMLSTILFYGCNNANKQTTSDTTPIGQESIQETTSSPTEPVVETNNSSKQVITKEDFDINYNQIIINDSVPFEELADKLGITLGNAGDNTEIKANVSVGGNDYRWNVLHYPNKEKEEMRIEYVLNETKGTAILVSIDLLKGKTYRNVAVGDSLNKLLSAYGDIAKPTYNTATTDCYCYILDKNLSDKIISIVVDKNSAKVTKISINYCENKAMEELGIPAFD